jgi:hypothetical protein
VTAVELPPKVLPVTVTGVEVPHTDSDVLPSVTVGPFIQAQNTVKAFPVVVQPAEFLTVIEWLPFAIPANDGEDWNVPLSNLYSMPEPTGFVTVIIAWLNPRVQSIV